MQALIIDDSRAMRMILSRILTAIGFSVAEASDGREGLAQLSRSRPDLVLVDWNMPGMSGLEFVRAVRAESSYAGIPLVMVTTETGMPQVADAMESGANKYVMKPFTQEALLAKLTMIGVIGS